MPRTNFDPKALSEGWKTLNNISKVPFSKKLLSSNRIIKKSLKEHNNSVVCWSGGKDSTVVLDLVRKKFPDVPVVFADTGVLFPETLDFVDKIANDWKLNLKVVKNKDVDFWNVGEKYGWPIFGKNVASNVERSLRSGNRRSQLNKLENFLLDVKAKISGKCAKYLLENPCMKFEKESESNLKFIGIRALESRARVRLWVDHGDLYPVKHYYGKNKPIYKSIPLSIWTDEDVDNYHIKNKIPICSLYKKGYNRNGCWTCAMAIKFGQLDRLYQYNKRKYNKLVYKTPMGDEIRRIIDLTIKNKGNHLPKLSLPK